MPKMDPMLKKAIEIIGSKGWGHFELKDLSDDKTTLADVQAHFPDKLAVLAALGHHIDQLMLTSLETFDPKESSRDRLFSIMMTRFDVLADLKPVIKSLWHDAWKDPMTALCSLPMGLNSMTWILQAASVDTTGIRGALRVKAFAVCYLATVWAWLSDETPDLDETMAALDKNLHHLNNFPNFYGDR